MFLYALVIWGMYGFVSVASDGGSRLRRSSGEDPFGIGCVVVLPEIVDEGFDEYGGNEEFVEVESDLTRYW